MRNPLSTVTFDKVTTVGNSAFEGSDLESINMPLATDIGYMAFGDCHNLTSVSLPKATNINHSAFKNCTSLQTITLDALEEAESSLFAGCASLKTVSLPKVVSFYSIFGNCFALESVSMPSATKARHHLFDIPAVGQPLEYTKLKTFVIATKGRVQFNHGDIFFKDVLPMSQVDITTHSSNANAGEKKFKYADDSTVGPFKSVTARND